MGKRTVFPDEQLISPPNKRPKLGDNTLIKTDARLVQSSEDLRKLLAFQQDATSALRQSNLFTLQKYIMALIKP